MFGRIVGTVFFGILLVALVGTGFWGYQEHQDKNSVLIKAENSYQRAFHDLNNNISNLEDELGKSIAMNSRELLAPCMANIWRISYAAQSNVGQLPLTLMPFSKTENLLAKLADFTYEIGMRDIENEPLSDKEWNQLKSLHKQAKDVQGELRKVQTKVLNDNLRWMDVEMAIASENNPIIDGLKTIDKQVEGYIETEWGATDNQFGDSFSDKRDKIDGPVVSEEQAKEKVKKFLFLGQDVEMEISNDKETEEYSAYSITVKHPDRDKPISVNVSKNGGHILWLLDSRDVEDTQVGLNEAQNKAVQFLKKNEINSMTAVQSDQYDNVGVFDFVSEKDGVRIYTDLIRVKVALDNGDILGYEALDYVVSHDEQKSIPKPKISLQEAKAKVNKNLQVQEDHLSLIEVKGGEVKLCYELLGTIADETYRIFVNAETGVEEKIEKMKTAQPML